MTKPTPAADKNTTSRYHMAPTVFSIPDRICNASMPRGEENAYKGTAWNIRQDGEAHKKFKSKGA